MEARTEVAGNRAGRTRNTVGPASVARRLATETKQAFKTTEFWGLAKAGSRDPYTERLGDANSRS
jgi:hypothetical protein